MQRKSLPKSTTNKSQIQVDGIEQFMNDIGLNQQIYQEPQEINLNESIEVYFPIYFIHKQQNSAICQKNKDSAYLRFYREKYAEFKQRFPARNQSEISKLISLAWKIQKQKDKETQQKTKIKPNNTKIETQLKKNNLPRNKKGENKVIVQNFHVKQNNGLVKINGENIKVPQRPISPFIRFYKAKSEEFKKTHLHLDYKQIREKISQGWKELSPQDKQIFIDQFEEENKEFVKQKNQFIETYGYYPSFMSKQEKQKALKYQQYIEKAEKEFKMIIQKSEEDKKINDQKDQSFKTKKTIKIQEKQKTRIEQPLKQQLESELEPRPHKKIQGAYQRSNNNVNPLRSILNQKITIHVN